MATNKLARELDTRMTAERPKQWQQPELLPEPDKQPGYSYRWIRVSTLDQSDAQLVSQVTRGLGACLSRRTTTIFTASRSQ